MAWTALSMFCLVVFGFVLMALLWMLHRTGINEFGSANVGRLTYPWRSEQHTKRAVSKEAVHSRGTQGQTFVKKKRKKPESLRWCQSDQEKPTDLWKANRSPDLRAAAQARRAMFKRQIIQRREKYHVPKEAPGPRKQLTFKSRDPDGARLSAPVWKKSFKAYRKKQNGFAGWGNKIQDFAVLIHGLKSNPKAWRVYDLPGEGYTGLFWLGKTDLLSGEPLSKQQRMDYDLFEKSWMSFDTDGTGRLSYQEFENLLKEIGLIYGRPARMEVDCMNTGRVTFYHAAEWWCSNSHLVADREDVMSVKKTRIATQVNAMDKAVHSSIPHYNAKLLSKKQLELAKKKAKQKTSHRRLKFKEFRAEKRAIQKLGERQMTTNSPWKAGSGRSWKFFRFFELLCDKNAFIVDIRMRTKDKKMVSQQYDISELINRGNQAWGKQGSFISETIWKAVDTLGLGYIEYGQIKNLFAYKGIPLFAVGSEQEDDYQAEIKKYVDRHKLSKPKDRFRYNWFLKAWFAAAAIEPAEVKPIIEEVLSKSVVRCGTHYYLRLLTPRGAKRLRASFRRKYDARSTVWREKRASLPNLKQNNWPSKLEIAMKKRDGAKSTFIYDLDKPYVIPFIAASNSKQVDTVLSIWKRYDEDGSGSMNRESLNDLLKEAFQTEVDQSEISQLFGGNDSVSYDEFSAWWFDKHVPVKVSAPAVSKDLKQKVSNIRQSEKAIEKKRRAKFSLQSPEKWAEKRQEARAKAGEKSDELKKWVDKQRQQYTPTKTRRRCKVNVLTRTPTKIRF